MKLWYDRKSKDPTYFVQLCYRNGKKVTALYFFQWLKDKAIRYPDTKSRAREKDVPTLEWWECGCNVSEGKATTVTSAAVKALPAA